MVPFFIITCRQEELPLKNQKHIDINKPFKTFIAHKHL